MVPVLQAMIERPPPSGWQLPPPSSVAFRDQMILHATAHRFHRNGQPSCGDAIGLAGADITARMIVREKNARAAM